MTNQIVEYENFVTTEIFRLYRGFEAFMGEGLDIKALHKALHTIGNSWVY